MNVHYKTMNPMILSCQTMTEYVQKAQTVCGTDFPIIELDRRYHADPAKMRTHIIETLQQIPDEIDTILVAMGFCGGSWQDVSCSKTVVIPKIADCVALALTTSDRYNPDLKEVGHMYLFGEGDNGFSVSAIYDSLCQEHDKVMADIIFDMYFEHYYHLDIIDNGLYDCYDSAYVAQAQKDADKIQAQLDFVPGSNLLLEKLVSGRWDHQFLVAAPYTNITQGRFFDC